MMISLMPDRPAKSDLPYETPSGNFPHAYYSLDPILFIMRTPNM